MAYEDYQTLGAMEQGGARFIAKDSFNFYLSDTDIDADRIKLILLSLTTFNKWGKSGNTTFSGASIISPAYGYHMYSASTGISKASLTLPVAEKGAILVLDFSNCVGDANVSIFADSGGGLANVSLVDYNSTKLSSLEISAAGRIEMMCQTDGIWTITYSSASVTERANA